MHRRAYQIPPPPAPPNTHTPMLCPSLPLLFLVFMNGMRNRRARTIMARPAGADDIRRQRGLSCGCQAVRNSYLLGPKCNGKIDPADCTKADTPPKATPIIQASTNTTIIERTSMHAVICRGGGGGAPLLVVGAALYCLPSPCHPKAKARYAVSNNDFDKVDADADSWWHANGTHTLSLPTADGDGRGVYVLPEGTKESSGRGATMKAAGRRSTAQPTL